MLLQETLDFLRSYANFSFKESSILLLLRLIFLFNEFLLNNESLSYFFPVESRLSLFLLLPSLFSGYWLSADSIRQFLR